jgi:hypothetical protein
MEKTRRKATPIGRINTKLGSFILPRWVNAAKAVTKPTHKQNPTINQ